MLFWEFEMKDLGNLKYFLGIVDQKGNLYKSQKYILDLLVEIGTSHDPADTPTIINHWLQTNENENLADKEQYQMVGKLIYISHTRQDIAYAVGVISKFMHLPQIQHFEAAIRIIRYLKETSGKGIFSKRNQYLLLATQMQIGLVMELEWNPLQLISLLLVQTYSLGEVKIKGGCTIKCWSRV